jgi:tRNA-specific 2-thiouridylase
MTTKTVAVAMSGGMDSSLAAALLVEQGFRVLGVTLKLRCIQSASEEGWERSCCAASSVTRARRVAHALGIPHRVIDAESEFARDVIAPFRDSYLAGRTPNPCVECNARIKFGFLWEKVRSLGCEALASGHYARRRWDPDRERILLSRGADLSKDQSYFLWRLSQDQLRPVVFPVGAMSKDEVRREVRARDLPVTEIPESQDVCFVPRGDYASWLESESPWDVPGGVIRDTAGRALGQHRGIHRYTIGQRRGLGVAVGSPRYVVRIDVEDRSVIVGEDADLWKDSLVATDVNLISVDRITEKTRVSAKIRYQHEPAPGSIEPSEGGVTVRFDEPQRAITPGQSAVFYQGDDVLGGGIIL